MTSRMEWERLLSRIRLGKGVEDEANAARSPFNQDFDRITFSSSFRRLQDKTQVFPLAASDYVRKRLTHSLEASCVGRSLGTGVGNNVIKEDSSLRERGISKYDFGEVVAAACLAHDIGNPPFGHSGEDAIRHWVTDSEPRLLPIVPDYSSLMDYRYFDGNAQGFRILTRLQYPASNYGLGLTCATLAVFTKYPVSSSQQDRYGAGKFGYFRSEREHFERVAEVTGLLKAPDGGWCRHPLSYLVEAADDICYRIIDFEDGIRLRHVEHSVGRDILERVVRDHGQGKHIEGLSAVEAMDDEDQIERLRSLVIGIIVDQVIAVFSENVDKIMQGEHLEKGLLNCVPCRDILAEIKALSKKHIYRARSILEIEAAGYTVIPGLLQIFFDAIQEVWQVESSDDPETERAKPEHNKSVKVANLLPIQCFDREVGPDARRPHFSGYERLQRITDYVAGMTDSFAVSAYRKLTGINLPSGAE